MNNKYKTFKRSVYETGVLQESCKESIFFFNSGKDKFLG